MLDQRWLRASLPSPPSLPPPSLLRPSPVPQTHGCDLVVLPSWQHEARLLSAVVLNSERAGARAGLPVPRGRATGAPADSEEEGKAASRFPNPTSLDKKIPEPLRFRASGVGEPSLRGRGGEALRGPSGSEEDGIGRSFDPLVPPLAMGGPRPPKLRKSGEKGATRPTGEGRGGQEGGGNRQ